VWSTDGTLTGNTAMGAVGEPISGLSRVAGDALVLTGDGGTRLWRLTTDGGAQLVADFGAEATHDFSPLGSLTVFATGIGAGARVWSTDGTSAAVLPVVGDAGARVDHLTAAGGVAVFSADDGVTGAEPWRTDGTPAGTFRVADLEPGAGSSSPTRFALAGNLLAFAASTVADGEEPWALRVDPTPPIITVSPADAGGWFSGDVAVSFSVADAESAVSRLLGCDGGVVTSDTAGQTFTCGAASQGGFTQASVTIRRDATAPRFTSCPSDVTQQVLTPTPMVAWPDAVAVDDLDPSPVVSYSPPRGQPFNVPGGTVTATATDHAGNTASCSFQVKLESAATPTVTCLQSVVREPADENGLTLASYPSEAVTATDPVDGSAVELVFDPPAGHTFPLDSTTPVTVTAVNSGRHASTPCTFELSITCTSDACRAKTAKAITPRSRYAFGCEAAPDGLVVGVLAWWAMRRRRARAS
jgi:ELWxxDGT repeat protein